MGLDMYLTGNLYVSGWKHRRDDEQELYDKIVELCGANEFVDPESPWGTVQLNVGYWRKANQIHKWFVDNVQKGEDDCRSYSVSRDQLRTLRELCLRVLADSELIDGTVHTGTIYDREHPQGAVQLEQGKIIADPRVAHSLLPPAEGFFFGGTDYDEGYVYDLRTTIENIDRALQMPDDWSFEYRSSW